MLSLNTHSYDGQLSAQLLPDLVGVKLLSLEEKKHRGIELRDTIKINPIASQYLNGIISCMGTNANVDPSNGLVADDLICLCWMYRDNTEFIKVLETQLVDMQTGFCPQGRTHRLFQTLMAFTIDDDWTPT